MGLLPSNVRLEQEHAEDLSGLLSWAEQVRYCGNTKGYSSTYLAMGFANVRAGTQKPHAHAPSQLPPISTRIVG